MLPGLQRCAQVWCMDLYVEFLPSLDDVFVCVSVCVDIHTYIRLGTDWRSLLCCFVDIPVVWRHWHLYDDSALLHEKCCTCIHWCRLHASLFFGCCRLRYVVQTSDFRARPSEALVFCATAVDTPHRSLLPSTDFEQSSCRGVASGRWAGTRAVLYVARHTTKRDVNSRPYE